MPRKFPGIRVFKCNICGEFRQPEDFLMKFAPRKHRWLLVCPRCGKGRYDLAQREGTLLPREFKTRAAWAEFKAKQAAYHAEQDARVLHEE